MAKKIAIKKVIKANNGKKVAEVPSKKVLTAGKSGKKKVN